MTLNDAICVGAVVSAGSIDTRLPHTGHDLCTLVRTGNDILEFCEPDDAFVAAYLMGLEDMAELAQAVTWMRTGKDVGAAMAMRPYCPPQGRRLASHPVLSVST